MNNNNTVYSGTYTFADVLSHCSDLQDRGGDLGIIIREAMASYPETRFADMVSMVRDYVADARRDAQGEV